jgi:hypothetical protein
VAGSYPEDEIARGIDKDLSPIPSNLEAYAQIEGLVGEEDELLEQPEESRKKEHRERLRRVSDDLDRAWEMLRHRAERRAKPGS